MKTFSRMMTYSLKTNHALSHIHINSVCTTNEIIVTLHCTGLIDETTSASDRLFKNK